MSCRPITHGRCGPLAGRLEQLVERAKAECRLRELGERDLCKEITLFAGAEPRLCRECGIPLLSKEVDICRHCEADRPRDQDQGTQ